MVEIAKANGVNVYHYLTYLVEKQPKDSMSDEELEQLAPWNEDVKAEINRRTKSSAEQSNLCELSRYSDRFSAVGYFSIDTGNLSAYHTLKFSSTIS